MSQPGVLAFFILYCDGDRARTAKSLFQEEIVKPSAGSRAASLEDFQNVVRDLVVNQELFDSMLRPLERNPGLPPGRSFKCLRGSTFALHQYAAGATAVRFFLMTDPTYSSTEAQRKLQAIYQGPFVDLVCRADSFSLRDLLDRPQELAPAPPVTAATAAANLSASVGGSAGGATPGGQQQQQQQQQQAQQDAPMHMVPALPLPIQIALRHEVLAILRS